MFLDYYGRLAIERGFVKARQAFAVLVLIFRRFKFSRQRGKAQGTEHQPFRRANRGPDGSQDRCFARRTGE
ncbi:hypothetical protein [Sinorhizobium meliloti]|uniref:hypothetical protein n=1 Tax=Rhizobium meliloti TaxID=382 RepID=UPI000FD448F4|nr:hypothetical protein [Sinorhizobium meliloti]RVJ82979.1 hypothetical protein CN173_34935 [Sinorhizobium meliloti]